MQVTNKAPFPVIAFGVCVDIGYGDDVTIPSGESAVVEGPYIGEMDGGNCYIHIEGEIVCQETPDDDVGFQVVCGVPLCLQVGTKGITVRHHLDVPEPYVIKWREQHPI